MKAQAQKTPIVLMSKAKAHSTESPSAEAPLLFIKPLGVKVLKPKAKAHGSLLIVLMNPKAPCTHIVKT